MRLLFLLSPVLIGENAALFMYTHTHKQTKNKKEKKESRPGLLIGGALKYSRW